MLNDFNSHPLSKTISDNYRADEAQLLQALIDNIQLSDEQVSEIQARAESLVQKVREERLSSGGIDAFMAQYDLSSMEGITLMCLAEALLRVPDSATADKLITDKISQGEWDEHRGKSDSTFVNAATWSLMLTGKVLDPRKWSESRLKKTLKVFLKSTGQPVIRKATRQAMKLIGKQFVMGETIQAALKRAIPHEKIGYRYSYDMLGEAAKTDADAKHYLKTYADAIHAIGKKTKGKNVIESAGISIKLSALHPRYELHKYDQVMDELLPRAKELALLAKNYDIGLTIDAEEADRLEISLKILEALSSDSELQDWNGLGLALQAYQRRAFYVIDWLADLARRTNRRFKLRLVKGAYWDSEIKWSQEQGLSSYPVFTRKDYTDVSYLGCARKILNNTDAFYPQFATHNAYSLSAVIEMAGDYKDYEFQCLHGMGDTLYNQVVGEKNLNIPCRIYAPVGTHEHLLAYLVRRLLENGANSSFVNRIVDEDTPISDLLEDPVKKAQGFKLQPHSKIPQPSNLFGDSRMNSKGLDLSDQDTLENLQQQMSAFAKEKQPTLTNTTEAEAEKAIATGVNAFNAWDHTPVQQRAQALNKLAELLEEHSPQLMSLMISEAGKTLANCLSEVREAVDFCRYYAQQAEELFAEPTTLPGPTGEKNQLSLHGRGCFVCISPWNFPLAIFLGQVTAALAAGNTVVAKPAEQTPLIAHYAFELLHQAGIPKEVAQLIIGDGKIGACLTNAKDISGVIFTGSTEVARHISVALAQKPGPIVPLVAETGGQNCMIVDSTALPEQVITDVVYSAFDSAGQRCSALRVLFVQDDVADTILTMLKGAMAELKVGNPSELSTDVGPVIDKDAQEKLLQHIEDMELHAKLIYQVTVDEDAQGTFVPPSAFEIKHINELENEQFGPVLHVIRFAENQLDDVIQQINSTGYGLTFGIHSRIAEKVERICQQVRAGNIYVNRNTIGAVVGVQPFGGEGLSGTGFKAGGPNYLLRLATERTVSEDTTASGGNASLMSLEEN